jgi:hypothetical protein
VSWCRGSWAVTVVLLVVGVGGLEVSWCRSVVGGWVVTWQLVVGGSAVGAVAAVADAADAVVIVCT